MVIFPVPIKVPGDPELTSLHSIVNPFKAWFAVMVSVDNGHAEPARLGLLLAALRYAPHVPLVDEHGATCVRIMVLPAHRFNVVKYHRVMIPVVAQVHFIIVPGQRG